MDELIKVFVGRTGASWVARSPSLNGLEARGATKERCLAELLAQGKRMLGKELALVEEEPPVLVGVSEAADILGWDRRKLAVYAARGHLPEPVADLASGRIWRRADIETYRTKLRRRGRRQTTENHGKP